MAKLDILVYPDQRLRRIAQPVTEFDDQLEGLVADMAETMYSAPGIGLAAVQVGVSKRVVVMDISEEKNDLRVFINPEVSELAGKTETEEGCLVGARRVRGGGARADRDHQRPGCERASVRGGRR